MIQENQLTEDKRNRLKQGTQVEFKIRFSSLLYRGFIEIDSAGRKYFCAEHNYKDGELTESGKTMQYYNTLESYCFYTHFKILK